MSKKKAAKATAKAEKKQAAPATGLYNQVELLQAERHGDLKMQPIEDMRFAAKMNSIVLAVTEFAAAARDYPIVFAETDGKIMPYAVTGYKQNENVFIDKDGNWRPNHYIPAFLRRYPFIFMENTQPNSFSLCIDASCPFLGKDKGEPLYVDGKPSELITRAVEFAKTFHAEADKTAHFCEHMKSLDLFVTQSAKFKTADAEEGAETVVGGFLVIDEERLNNLSDEEFLKLRQTKALGIIYSHLLSMRSWSHIMG